jgi:predicted aspartyl protease
MHQLLLLIFAHLPFVEGVYVNNQGPFRFAFDTGAESTSIDAALARSIGLTPQYRVEVVTAAASSLAPALRTQIRAGQTTAPDSEAILLPLNGQPGILGQSTLRHLDYQIDTATNQVHLGATPQPNALALPLRYQGHRIVVTIRSGGQDFDLVLDSGTNAILLPTSPKSFRAQGTAALQTHNGTGSLPYGQLGHLQVASLHLKNAPAAIHPNHPGLLPTSLFRKITVSNSTGTLYLEK